MSDEDVLIRSLRVENEHLRELLNTGWLVVNDPANSFLAAEPWSREVEKLLGTIQGCMRPARGAQRPARSGLANAFGSEARR